MVSEAQKRAKAKYDKEHYKMWNSRLKPEDFAAIETERKKQGLTRAELLKKLIKEQEFLAVTVRTTNDEEPTTAPQGTNLYYCSIISFCGQ